MVDSAFEISCYKNGPPLPEKSKPIITEELPKELQEKFQNIVTFLMGKLSEDSVFRRKDLLYSLCLLVYKLGPQIGDYDILVSDEVSGRLPTLIIRKIANRKRAAQGKPPVKTIFIKGGLSVLNEATLPAISNVLAKITKPTLIVTEYIDTGTTVEHFVHLLPKGSTYKIAAISVNPSLLGMKLRKKFPFFSSWRLKGAVVLGMKGNEGLALYREHEASGVAKPKEGSLQYKEISPYPVRYHPEDEGREKEVRGKIIQARKDVKVIADVLYNELVEGL